jgi:glycosyltransferase involved in cell wall biosynthesis
LRILHVVSGDLAGGAARGAYWLHKGLIDIGIESSMLTNSGQTFGDQTIFCTSNSPKSKLANMIFRKLDGISAAIYPNRNRVIFSTGFVGMNIRNREEFQGADIVHLHWINDGFVNIKHLRNVKKPIIWTMRDMWPMTGGCHYSLSCSKFKHGCGTCDQLRSNTSYDLSRAVLSRKKKYLPKNMTLVGISSWLSDQARESSIFRDFDIRTIPNNIDTNEFFVVDKSTARKVLGIETTKKIVLVGAQNITDFYKGFDKFIEATKLLNKEEYMLLFFGRFDSSAAKSLGLDFINLGFLYDAVSLRLAYSAADVFVAPSLMDAFGKTLVESMACGTPVVCFDATGPKDIIVHKVTGYKSRPFDYEDLARGIGWVAEHKNSALLSSASRERAVSNFDCRVIARQYAELYKDIIGVEEKI